MLQPDFYFDSVFQIPYESLYQQGLRGLIYDIDNTLAGYDERRPPLRVVSLVKRLQGLGFQVGLLSNNNAARVETFNESMQLPGKAAAIKPRRGPLKQLIHEMGLSPKETALNGDQLFTDVWCGKRVGVTTVLVKPLTEQDVLSVRIKRGLERRMLRKFLEANT